MIQQVVGDRKIPIAVAISIVMAGFALHEWSDTHFVTKAYAEAEDSKLAMQIESNSNLLKSHISEYKLNECKKAIQTTQDQQFNLAQYVAANGHTDITRRREEELRRRLADLEDLKDCLQSGRQNCQ